MATYLELRSLLRGQDDLVQKVQGAVIISADTILNEGTATLNHANRVIWAKQAYQDWALKAQEMLPALIAANKTASKATILAASDSIIQTNVDAAVDLFADGS